MDAYDKHCYLKIRFNGSNSLFSQKFTYKVKGCFKKKSNKHVL